MRNTWDDPEPRRLRMPTMLEEAAAFVITFAGCMGVVVLAWLVSDLMGGVR